MFQITYYFYAYFRQFPNCDGEMSFSVPTGNFGDILAGYYAKRMGLPVRHLIIATNANDILNRFFTSGVYDKYPVIQTFSPSMDIGISSNFERYLFYLFGEDSKKLSAMMEEFNKTGRLEVDEATLKMAQHDFLAACCTEDMTVETIARYYKEHGYTLDPHTACGVSAVRADARQDGPRVQGRRQQAPHGDPLHRPPRQVRAGRRQVDGRVGGAAQGARRPQGLGGALLGPPGVHAKGQEHDHRHAPGPNGRAQRVHHQAPVHPRRHRRRSARRRVRRGGAAPRRRARLQRRRRTVRGGGRGAIGAARRAGARAAQIACRQRGGQARP